MLGVPARYLREQVLVALTSVALWGGIVVGGMDHSSAQLAIAAIGAVGLSLRVVFGGPLRLPPVALPIGVLLVGCLAQSLPVPPALKYALNPVAARVEGASLRGIEDPGTWRPLSADPAATLHAAAWLGGLLAISIVVAGFEGSSRRRALPRSLLGAVSGFLLIAGFAA